MSRQIFTAFGIFCIGYYCIVNAALIKSKKKIIFLGMNVTNSPSLIYENAVTDVSIAPFPPGGSLELTMNFTLAITAEASDGFIRSSILMRQPNTDTYTPLVVGKRHNLCALLKKTKVDIYLHKLVSTMNRYTPFLTHCPLVVGEYGLNHFTPDDDVVPAFMPISTYLIKIQFYHLIEKRFYNVVTINIGVGLKNA